MMQSPEEFTKKILQTQSPEERETLIIDEAEKAEDYSKIQSYTDETSIYYNDQHALIQGITGAGKSTLLFTLEKEFLDRTEACILHRDDGGLEFLNIARYVKTRVFIPDSADISLNFIGLKPEAVKVVRFNDPGEIIEQVWNYDYRYNVIVFDVFCQSYAQLAEFYSSFFQRLIFFLQQKRKSEKRLVVLSLDEMNDIIAPKGKATPEMAMTSRDIERNIRKIRKHKVKLIGDTHRFNQIGLDTRSQFQKVFIKKSYGYDLWEFLNKNLATNNHKTLWKVIKKGTRLKPNQYILFDENQCFDLYEFPDIPRPDSSEIDIEALGSLELPQKEDKRQNKTKQHLGKAMKLLIDKYGLTQQQCAKELGVSQQQISNIMRSLDEDAA